MIEKRRFLAPRSSLNPLDLQKEFFVVILLATSADEIYLCCLKIGPVARVKGFEHEGQFWTFIVQETLFVLTINSIGHSKLAITRLNFCKIAEQLDTSSYSWKIAHDSIKMIG